MPGFVKRQVAEWSFTTTREYENPFADVAVDAVFTSPGGTARTMPLFYDGDGQWKLRFNPGEAGTWQVTLASRPANPDFARSFSFEVENAETRGFLRATPGEAWGFRFEDGTPAFLSGDTTYDLFGMAYCGGNVEGFLRRRKEQGFNLFRTRLHVSYFHPPAGDFEWQTRRMWPWGGSNTSPRFDLFNLDWFKSVDETIGMIEDLGLGLEMIMEGWGFEFPFNHRGWFTAEWEALWMRYLIARYDAFNCVWFWTPLNEYEYYPNGDWHWTPTADRWALRIGRWIKETASHGHILTMHNGPTLPPFAKRFRADPEAVDTIMFQEWGTRGRDDGWLAAGIEESIAAAFEGWHGSAVLAEWGYERNPSYKLKLPIHEFCDRNHTRRSAWRGVFSGVGIIAGFENSWGPWMDLDTDLPGVGDLVILNRFLTETVAFDTLRPAPDLVSGSFAPGHEPRGLRSADGKLALAYFPAGGSAAIAADGKAEWLDPRTGETSPASASDGQFTCPDAIDADGRPHDYVLIVRAA